MGREAVGLEDAAAGQVLRRLRQAANLTQAQLGEHIGVSYQQIQKYEVGSNRIALPTAFRLAKALNITASAFVAEIETELAATGG